MILASHPLPMPIARVGTMTWAVRKKHKVGVNTVCSSVLLVEKTYVDSLLKNMCRRGRKHGPVRISAAAFAQKLDLHFVDSYPPLVLPPPYLRIFDFSPIRALLRVLEHAAIAHSLRPREFGLPS